MKIHNVFASASIALAMLVTPMSAIGLELEYKGFYKRLKLINDNELDLITMGFYLVDNHTRQRCELKNVRALAKGMPAQNVDIGIDNQILVPYSQAHYDNFGYLQVQQQDPRQDCTLQMQIQFKDKEQKAFSFNDLTQVKEQMQELVDEFGSFLWFMMPNLQGLHFELDANNHLDFVDPSIKSLLQCSATTCQLALPEEFDATDIALEFNQPPLVIAPWMEK
ncbi:DUF2987 domain-containing protein [Thalassotalea aquiviva]|uniref:DUF2987 domain-containing protein n=1 Tax=Thalassotalea aquiviva TaxID=3242415 RepID=UPI003529EDAF